MALTITYDGQNVTSEAFAVNIRRGRNRNLDEFEPVSGSVTFRNYNANWTPPFLVTPSYLLMEERSYLLLENGSKIMLEQGSQASGDFGVIELGRSITIDDGAVRVFTGHVEDVLFRYDRSGYTDATIILGDGLTTLGNSWFEDDWTATDNQLPGERITSVLNRDDIAFPSGGSYRNISDGQSPLMGDDVAVGTNALRYCQLVSQSEFGKLFVDANGVLQFKGRYDFPSSTPAADFDDDGTNLPFSGVDVDYGTELLKSSASVQAVGGPVRMADGSALPTRLGKRNLAVTGLLLRHDGDVRARAAFLAEKYSQTDTRVSALEVILDDLDTSDRATVAGLDIHDTITWTWTPTGSDAEISQTLVIEGVTFIVDLYGAARVQLQLSDYPNTNYFYWDTDSYDSGVPFGF